MSGDNYRRYRFYLIAATALFRLIYVNLVPLVPEEAYYWKYAKHLALSYFDHPPLVAYVIALFTWIGGDSALFVRLGAVILSSGILMLLYAIVDRLCAKPRLALLTLLAVNCTVVFALGSVVMTPDTPLLFFWTLGVYGLIRLQESGSPKWWYLVGLGLGLGLLSKYTAVLLVPGVLAYLLFSRGQRRWLLTAHPYLALAMGLAIFGPVIAWNYNHQWASFAFQLPSRFSHGSRLRPGFTLQLFLTQLGLLTPYIFLVVIAGWFQAGLRSLRSGSVKYSLLFWIAVPVYVVFVLSSFVRLVKMNWLAPAYVTSLVAGIVWLDSSPTRLSAYLRRWLKPGLILGLALVALAHLVPAVPLVPMRKADTWTGWKELASRVAEVQKEMGPGTFVFGDGYQVPSEVTFYTPNHEPTYSGEIIGQEGLEYDYWTNVRPLIGRNAVFARSDSRGKPDVAKLRKHFDSVEQDVPLEIIRNGRVFRTFFIYRCYGYRGPGDPVRWGSGVGAPVGDLRSAFAKGYIVATCSRPSPVFSRR